jgi:hypothetical protein
MASDPPASFAEFEKWIDDQIAQGNFTGDFENWDGTQFNDRNDATYNATYGVGDQFNDIANGTDPAFEAYRQTQMEQFGADADRTRQANSQYLGRSGVTGSAALNQITGTENELSLANRGLTSELGMTQMQRQFDALSGAQSAYGQAGAQNAGAAGVNQAGTNQNNAWEQQGVDNAYGMADIMAMFPAFDIAWATTGDQTTEEDYAKWLAEYLASHPNAGGGGGGGPETTDGSDAENPRSGYNDPYGDSRD